MTGTGACPISAAWPAEFGQSVAVNDRWQAAIYRRGNAFYVTGEDQTAEGFFVIGSVRRVDATESDHALGAAVLAALEGSRNDVPTPGRDAPVSGPLLEASGTKTGHVRKAR